MLTINKRTKRGAFDLRQSHGGNAVVDLLLSMLRSRCLHPHNEKKREQKGKEKKI